MSNLKRVLVLALVSGTICGAAMAAGPQFSAWSTAQKLDEIAGNHADVNTPSIDGCPIQSPDGLSLYMASNRPGSMESSPGVRSLDIWVAHRESIDAPFGEPVNLGSPINSAADDFCPTPVRGKGLFFVSRRVVAGVTCGLGDIYFARLNPHHGWSAPEHLGCAPAGPNTALDEQGPSYFEADGSRQLYFSSSRVPAQGGLVPGDIYVSTESEDDTFGPGSLVSELSGTTAAATPANDIQPNVRKDGREIVFSSDRSGTLGGQDIYVATRDSTADPWSAPVNLGSAINKEAAETRPSLSWDAQTLYFGRAPGSEGMSDIYVATRSKLQGSDG
jgi:WD40-like Beta Propeller Repeat